MVEREQEQRDRRLEQTIAVAGFGLATSQIASSVIIAQQPPPKDVPFYLTSVFWQSIIAGVVASSILLAILKIYRFWNK